MDTLLKGGVVYPVAAAPVRDGAIAVHKGLIEAVGHASDFQERDFDEVISLSGQTLTPGFVNAHSHLQFSAARGKIPRGLSFADWIRRVIAFNASATAEEIFRGVEEGVAEMIATGTTSVADVASDVRCSRLVARSKLGSVCFAEVIEPREEEADGAFKGAAARISEMRKTGAKPGLSPHAPYTVSLRLFASLKSLAREESLPLMLHLAETAEEDEFIRRGTGDLAGLLAERGNKPGSFKAHQKSPVRLLGDAGLLDDALAVHLNTVDESELDVLAASRATPVFCPGSSWWFGRHKVMPLDAMFEAGMRPAIGTDSLASNHSLSMLEELRRAAEYFPSIKRGRLMEAATLNGARALGLNCGSIEKGRRADIISFKGEDFGGRLDSVFGAKRPEFVMINGVRMNAENP
ncbi:MAG: amidohydrolase family protein [Nitrospinae bacterium]|nr:amidohydrolase family protein [Nitrospinota bacterium]